jgi:hypothetical protein
MIWMIPMIMTVFHNWRLSAGEKRITTIQKEALIEGLFAFRWAQIESEMTL